MNVEKSLLGPDVNLIISKKNNGTNEVTHKVIIHVPEYEINIEKIVSVEELKDYNSNLGDHIFIDFLCPMGDLVKSLYPNRNNMEVSLIKSTGGVIEHERYKLILLNVNTELGSGKYKKMSLEELNKQEYVSLKGQCLVREIEAIRLAKIDGIYRDCNVENLMKGLFNYTLNGVTVNSSPTKAHVTVTKPDNSRIYDHIILPAGTKLIDLPTFLQETNYGVYNGGIGTYITKQRLGTFISNRCDLKPTGIPCDKVLSVHIYPLYRTNVVETGKQKLVIYGLPNMKFDMIENTYNIDDNTIKIISNDSSKKVNKGDSNFMQHGIGYISLDANKVMHRPVEVKEEEVINTKDKINLDSYLKNRSDGSMYRQTKETTDNLYHRRSDYLKENGDMLQLQWKFSNNKYLLPGMPVVYVFLGDDNNVKRLNGVLQSHYTLYNNSSKMASTILNVFMEKDKDEID